MPPLPPVPVPGGPGAPIPPVPTPGAPGPTPGPPAPAAASGSQPPAPPSSGAAAASSESTSVCCLLAYYALALCVRRSPLLFSYSFSISLLRLDHLSCLVCKVTPAAAGTSAEAGGPPPGPEPRWLYIDAEGSYLLPHLHAHTQGGLVFPPIQQQLLI